MKRNLSLDLDSTHRPLSLQSAGSLVQKHSFSSRDMCCSFDSIYTNQYFDHHRQRKNLLIEDYRDIESDATKIETQMAATGKPKLMDNNIQDEQFPEEKHHLRQSKYLRPNSALSKGKETIAI